MFPDSTNNADKIIFDYIEEEGASVNGLKKILEENPNYDFFKAEFQMLNILEQSLLAPNLKIAEYLMKNHEGVKKLINHYHKGGETLLKTMIWSIGESSIMYGNREQQESINFKINRLKLLIKSGADCSQMCCRTRLQVAPLIYAIKRASNVDWFREEYFVRVPVSLNDPEVQAKIKAYKQAVMILLKNGAESQKFCLLNLALNDNNSTVSFLNNNIINLFKKSYFENFGDESIKAKLSDTIKSHRNDIKKITQFLVEDQNSESLPSLLPEDILGEITAKFIEACYLV